MDERLLRSFVTTARLGSVTLAAGRLNLTQPALSRQIQRLERDLGLPLFSREGRSLRLSPQGERLLADAQEVLAAGRRLHDSVAELRRGECGVLRVGACSQVIEWHMTQILPRWRCENPNVDIRLEEGGGAELSRRLAADEVSIAITASHFASPDRFERLDIGAMRVRAFSRPGTFATNGTAIAFADLCEQPLLLLNCRHFTRAVMEDAARAMQCLLRPALEAGSPHTLTAIAANGGGVAVVPDLGLQANTGLAAHDILVDGVPLAFEMSAIWLRSQPLPGYGRRFIEMLRRDLLVGHEGAATGAMAGAPA
ncbi:MAG: LysR family transcriptional regulator [Rubellimicrobium sp.]|nr:LysR family transcriptional regulator [Rubellimicrobium sp.]